MEAIILKTIPYGESDLIIKLFSKERGRVDLYGRGLRSSRRRGNALCSPLERCELEIGERKKGMPFLKSACSIDQHLHLREEFGRLEAGQRFALALLRSQPSERPAPELYALFCLFLRSLKSFPCPPLLSAVFHLKILLHEGLLSLEGLCCRCGLPSLSPLFFEGEPFCSLHAPLQSLTLLEEEWQLIAFLTKNRSLEALERFPLPLELPSKVFSLFNQILSSPS